MQYMIRRLWHGLFGIYAAVVFAAFVLPALALVAVAPRLSTRRRIVRAAATGMFCLTGTRLTVRGLSHIPAEPCVVVANHASYLDGPILTAALPPRFGFVIKREMTRVPLAHFLLRRIGSEFVERNDTHKSAADARRILQKARAQESLAFFPEGTFRREAGLRRFHNGAFAAAIRAQVPVVPVVIRGSRRMLPAAQILPGPGHIEIFIKAPLFPRPETLVADLLEDARRSILADLDEPDLQAQGT
ncbi:MAG: 1-acyl-sn-glycerol-3-phosphate acyltransferase [Gammaproteobacteria bacterium]|nr:1-acyl-sn-glycerol-3-phosphate acyltransferase [Gammaproteobacteria bacterium]